MKRFSRWVGAFGLVAALSPAFAQSAPPEIAMIPANPAMWTVHGTKGTAYLFGSIHVLPPNMQWRTPRIDAAMKSADTFYFEVPMDDSAKAQILDFVQKNGSLPAGTTLPSLLTPEARADYDAVLQLTHVPPGALENRRPWLAMLFLDVAMLTQQHLSPDAGLDKQVYAAAQAIGGKSFGAFETPEQQFALVMPKNKKLEIEEFDVQLKDLRTDSMSLGGMIDAWAHGDVKTLGRIINAGFKGHPEAEKSLFADRNAAWMTQLKVMLNEPHTYFITVGAGHLAGPKGVPALLRAKGYRVEGP